MTRPIGETLRHLLALAAAGAAAFAVLYGIVDGPARHVVVAGDSMLPALRSGDVVVTLRQAEYRVGDVVAYRVPEGEPGAGIVVIHRVVRITPKGLLLKGDNNDGLDPWTPSGADVLGREALVVPRLGLAIALLRSTLGLALVAGLVTFLVALGGEARSSETGTPRRPDARWWRRASAPILRVWPGRSLRRSAPAPSSPARPRASDAPSPAQAGLQPTASPSGSTSAGRAA